MQYLGSQEAIKKLVKKSPITLLDYEHWHCCDYENCAFVTGSHKLCGKFSYSTCLQNFCTYCLLFLSILGGNSHLETRKTRFMAVSVRSRTSLESTTLPRLDEFKDENGHRPNNIKWDCRHKRTSTSCLLWARENNNQGFQTFGKFSNKQPLYKESRGKWSTFKIWLFILFPNEIEP